MPAVAISGINAANSCVPVPRHLQMVSAIKGMVAGTTPLGDFRELMGSLYGVAGLAHAADLATSNALPALAGAPAFGDLPPTGQALAAFWALTGPIAFVLSRKGAGYAEAGLVLYGATEVGLAALVTSVYATDAPTLVNSLGVQAWVFGAWVWARSRSGPP